MDFWVITAIILGGIIFIFFIYALLQPRKWEVTERALVASDPETLYPYLNHIRNWEEWTIWNRESNEKFSFEYEGPEEGPGATQHWRARRRDGRIQLTGGTFNKRIDFKFSFGKGRQVVPGHIALVPKEGGTEVTWTMNGDTGDSPAARVMAKMMKPYMQKDFQRSLAKLQSKFEA